MATPAQTPGPVLMNRTMLEDADGYPLPGDTRDHLGALLSGKDPDVLVDQDGFVGPGQGGMSVFLGNPRKMSRLRRPRYLGGECRHPLFQMDAAGLTAALRLEPNSNPKSTHRVVEPGARCHHTSYQAALHQTKPRWTKREAHDDL